MGLLDWITGNTSVKKREMDIEESSGLKKIWFMIRYELPESNFSLLANSNNVNLSGVSLVQAQFTDVFYSTLYKSFEQAGISTDKIFYDLATELYENYDKRKIIVSRLYGVALAIFIHKAATISNTVVCKKNIAKFIDNSRLNTELKNEIKNSFLYMTNFYNDKMTGFGTEGAIVSHDLGAIAYSLVDKKLGKSNYADPLYMMAAAIAYTSTHKEIMIINYNIDNLKKSNFLDNEKTDNNTSFTVDGVRYQAKTKLISPRKNKKGEK